MAFERLTPNPIGFVQSTYSLFTHRITKINIQQIILLELINNHFYFKSYEQWHHNMLCKRSSHKLCGESEMEIHRLLPEKCYSVSYMLMNGTNFVNHIHKPLTHLKKGLCNSMILCNSTHSFSYIKPTGMYMI